MESRIGYALLKEFEDLDKNMIVFSSLEKAQAVISAAHYPSYHPIRVEVTRLEWNGMEFVKP